MERGRNSMHQWQRRLKKAWLAIKNTVLPFFLLFVILWLPMVTSVIFGPHVYLTIKRIVSCSVLPLCVWLNKRPESRVLLALVLCASRFTAGSIYGSRTLKCRSDQELCIDERDREFFINEIQSIAISCASTMLAIVLWELMRERHWTPLNDMMLAYSLSAVLDFSFVRAEVFSFLAFLCLILLKILHNYGCIMSYRVHNRIEIINGYDIFWSFVLACCINALKDTGYIMHIEVLQGIETAYILYIGYSLNLLTRWLVQSLVFHNAARPHE